MHDTYLHIANADGSLDKHLGKIERAFTRAKKTVGKSLALDKVDVLCINDPETVIPELGIGGYTPSRHTVYLSLNPVHKLDEDQIYYTLCHELCHAKRYEGPGYGQTLFDSIIFEGIAEAFEYEISKGKAYVPSVISQRKGTLNLIKKSAEHFSEQEYNHHHWFFNPETKDLPRWAGYQMGYYIVDRYVKANKKPVIDFVLEDAGTFLKFTQTLL